MQEKVKQRYTEILRDKTIDAKIDKLNKITSPVDYNK